MCTSVPWFVGKIKDHYAHFRVLAGPVTVLFFCLVSVVHRLDLDFPDWIPYDFMNSYYRVAAGQAVAFEDL